MSERMSLSIEVINKVMTVLSQMPYQQVQAVIEEIRADAKPIEDTPELQVVETG